MRGKNDRLTGECSPRATAKFTKFSPCYLWPWFGDGPQMAVQYVVFPFFVYDVMFSHNGANGPESQATRMFPSVREVAALGA